MRRWPKRKCGIFGGTAYTDVDTMLNDQKFDGVIVVGPFQIARATSAKGPPNRGIPRHRLKSAGPTLAMAQELVNLERRKDLRHDGLHETVSVSATRRSARS